MKPKFRTAATSIRIYSPHCTYIYTLAGVLVGLEATQYSVSESGEVVEVCVIATGKDPHCSYGLPFQVHLSTADKSAGTSYITGVWLGLCQNCRERSYIKCLEFSSVTRVVLGSVCRSGLEVSSFQSL